MNFLTYFNQYFSQHTKLQRILFIGLAFCCLMPFVSSTMALILGILVALVMNNPFIATTQRLTQKLLQFSVVGLGFGMNAHSALKAGKEGFLMTIASIIAVLILGFLLTRLLKIDKVTGYLVAAGTAICGGSAIAAIAPVVKAKSNQISVALAIVLI